MAGAGELTLQGPVLSSGPSAAKGLEWCGLIAVVLHLGVLLWAAGQGGRPGAAGAPGEHLQVFQVRTVAVTAPTQSAPAVPPAWRAAVPSPSGGREAPKPAAKEVPPNERAPAAGTPGVGGENGDDAYLPRSMLSQPPLAVDPIDVPYPVIPGDPGHHVARLWLYIDETGTVQRVTAEPGDVPEPLAEAARRAFLAARFEPGQLEGRPVRSRIHIEVRFDATPVRP